MMMKSRRASEIGDRLSKWRIYTMKDANLLLSNIRKFLAQSPKNGRFGAKCRRRNCVRYLGLSSFSSGNTFHARPIQAQIDLAAGPSQLSVAKTASPVSNPAKAWAVVKADAYGSWFLAHGRRRAGGGHR